MDGWMDGWETDALSLAHPLFFFQQILLGLAHSLTDTPSALALQWLPQHTFRLLLRKTVVVARNV